MLSGAASGLGVDGAALEDLGARSSKRMRRAAWWVFAAAAAAATEPWGAPLLDRGVVAFAHVSRRPASP